MRVVVHDYSGHPFQVQLSRELARRGHVIAHWYCSSYSTGKGELTRLADDPPTLSISAVSMASTFQRYSPVKRVGQEFVYGRELGRRLVSLDPDVVLFCNTPLIAHALAARICTRRSIPMVFWQQDIYSAAIAAAAAERLGRTGVIIGRLADAIERHVARSSRAMIVISGEFLSTLERWGVKDRSTVIPNWAPLPEIPVRPPDNAWAAAHDLVGRPVALYSGTLGLKHDPAVLLATARAMQDDLPAGRVVVISEGLGREWLAERQQRERLHNLLLLDYQPYRTLADVLGSADILIALLEPSAGRFSVPSKILSYLCAGRAIVAVVPSGNAAATIVRASGGGMVVEPGSSHDAVTAILNLLRDDSRRAAMALAARQYAEATFDVAAIADLFEPILARVASSRRPR